MDRSINSSQLQSNSSQSKALIQSLTDPSVSGRQQNRNNSSRRRNEFSNKNVTKYQPNSSQRLSHSKGGRSRGSGAVANAVNCDLWADNLNQCSSEQLGDKSENKKPFGSKKHNLNHLLNFTFDSRDQSFNEHRFDRKFGQRYGRVGIFRGYNKEYFLQANCQFVVNDLNDYSIHSSDPDTCVDWNSIEEIRFNSLTAETYCPICLDRPVAPKMTRCGHIYCWSCALHYLSLSDQKWRKCPICFDCIQSDDLKTVSSINKIDYKVGDFITLSLMKRKKGSTIASPVFLYDSNKNCVNQKFEPLDGDPVMSSYQKILIATPNQVLNKIIDRERTQLIAQMAVDRDTPEVCFIETALDQLKTREESLSKRCQHKDNEKPIDSNANQGTNDEFYYFYQSEDGQHIYLHSLNVRILKHEFGSLENSPTKIFAKIIDTEWESMSEEMRKRHRYLQHLTLTCEYRTVELEFNTELISNKTLELFRPEVIRRQKIRSKRAREEKRRERHIQVEQNKRIHGIYPRPKYQLDNKHQFPNWTENNDDQRSPSPVYSSESSAVDFPLNATKDNSIDYGCSPLSEAEFPSFASMLREGKALKEVPKKSNKLNAINESSNNDSEDEYQRPTHNYSLCDAFELALELKSTDPQSHSEAKKGGSKKKKPKLLMSTGMKRTY